MAAGENMIGNNGFICPRCQKSFQPAEGCEVSCACGKFIMRRHGDVWLLPSYDPDSYYADVSRPALQYLLRVAPVKGALRQAMEDRFGRVCHSRITEYALSLRRALFMEFIDLPARARVLDYGCGFGALGLATAPIADRVFLVDSTLERVAFAQTHAKELGYDNTVAIAGSEWEDLPIPQRSLDLIVLNGILEWLPEIRSGDPAAIQWEFLATMQGLLKPGGYLMLAIENRYAFRYIAGYTNDHPGIKFTSLMPRWMANVYMKWRLGRPYRTLTWPRGTYLRQLPRLGYETPRFVYMWPDYRFPQRACWMDDPVAFAALCKQHPQSREHKMFSLLGVIPSRNLVYSFAVISRAL